MFMGEFDHTTDPKGRLIVPSKFREELGNAFVVTRGFDGCLFAYPNTEWEKVVEGLRSLSLVDTKGRGFTRFFLSNAETVEMDKQGRILISEKLRNFAGIVKDVVSVGVDNKLEIWNKETYEKLETAPEDIDDILQKLSELNVRL